MSTKKWHIVLGELRSMDIALMGIQNMLGCLQNAPKTEDISGADLNKGVYQALDDFGRIANNFTTHLTRLGARTTCALC